jgi:hypothetical protein
MNSSWHNIKSVWLHVHFRDKNKSSYVRLFVSHKVITVEEVVKHLIAEEGFNPNRDNVVFYTDIPEGIRIHKTICFLS